MTLAYRRRCSTRVTGANPCDAPRAFLGMALRPCATEDTCLPCTAFATCYDNSLLQVTSHKLLQPTRRNSCTQPATPPVPLALPTCLLLGLCTSSLASCCSVLGLSSASACLLTCRASRRANCPVPHPAHITPRCPDLLTSTRLPPPSLEGQPHRRLAPGSVRTPALRLRYYKEGTIRPSKGARAPRSRGTISGPKGNHPPPSWLPTFHNRATGLRVKRVSAAAQRVEAKPKPAKAPPTYSKPH